MKVYLMLDGEPLDRRSIMIVGSESDAEALVECGHSDFYEVIEVHDHKDVEEVLLDYRMSRG